MRYKQLIENTQGITIGDSLVGSNGIKYQMPGGYIDIKVSDNQYAPRSQSVVDFVVDEDKRGQGIGKKLLAYAMTKHPDIGAQVSSTASVRVFYDAGFRNPQITSGSFADHEAMRIEGTSVFMALNDSNGSKYK